MLPDLLWNYLRNYKFPNDKNITAYVNQICLQHYIKHVNNKQEFENSVSLQQVFKHHNCSLFQSSLNVLSGF